MDKVDQIDSCQIIYRFKNIEKIFDLNSKMHR